MARERLNKGYLEKIIKMSVLYSEKDINALGVQNDINTTRLSYLIGSVQKSVSEKSREDLQIEANDPILKIICHTRLQLPEDDNSYRNAIDRLFDENRTKLMKIQYDEAICRTRELDVPASLRTPIQKNPQPEKSEEQNVTNLIDTSLGNISNDIDDLLKYSENVIIISDPTKITELGERPSTDIIYNTTESTVPNSDQEAMQRCIEILRDANLLNYVSNINFASCWAYTNYTLYDMITSAFIEYLKTNSIFEHISTFGHDRAWLFVNDIEEYMYDIAMAKRTDDITTNLNKKVLYNRALYSYLPYFSEYVKTPKYFTNEMLHKLLEDYITHPAVCNDSDVYTLYQLDRLSKKCGFDSTNAKYPMFFEASLNKLCRDTLYNSYETIKNFINTNTMRIYIGKNDQFSFYFHTENKINNLFNFTHHDDFIKFYRSGFEIKDLPDTHHSNIERVVLRMISLRVNIHNEIISLKKGMRNKLEDLRIQSPILDNVPYCNIIAKLGKENITDELDILIRRYIACCNNYNTIVNSNEEVPQIVKNLRVLYEIARREFNEGPEVF